VKKLRVNTANCSHKELVVIAIKSGFTFFEGNKHTKIKTLFGDFITEVPRHHVLDKHTAKGIVEAMIAHGAKIDFF
jgi:hypothetical protein